MLDIPDKRTPARQEADLPPHFSEQVREVLDRVTDYVVAFDREWRCTYINAAAAAVVGMRPDELIGKSIWDLFPPSLGSGLVEPLLRAMDSGEPSHFQGYSPAADRWYECHCYPSDSGLSVYYRDVTESREAAETLKASEERFRLIAENIREVFYVSDHRNDRMTYVSPAYDEVWGRSVQSLYADARSFAESIHPADRHRFEAALQEHLRGVQTAIEYRIVRPDGSVRWIYDRSFPTTDDSGQIDRVIGIAEDVTGRKIADVELRGRLRELALVHDLSTHVARAATPQQIYASALDAVTEGLRVYRASVLLFDECGVIRFKAWRGLSDEYRAAVEGHSPWTIDTHNPAPVVTHDVREDPTLKPYQHIFLQEGIRALAFIPLTYEGRLLGKFMAYDAEPRTFTRDEIRLAQTVANHVAFAIERHRAQVAVQESEQRYRMLSEMTSDYIFSYVRQPDGSFVAEWISDAFSRITGYSSTEVASQALWSRFVHPDDTDVVRRFMVDMAEGRPAVAEFRFLARSGGIRFLRIYGRPIRDEATGDVIRIIGAGQDITSGKEAAQELRSVNETLETRVAERTCELEMTNEHLQRVIGERIRAERALERTNMALARSNRELQDFAHVASHDLQEPLRKITTFTDMLLSEAESGLGEHAAEYLERIQNAAYRMSALIHDLLAYSRIETQERNIIRLDLNELVRQVLSDLEISITETGAVIRVDDLPMIEADPVQIRQLFQNLIGNALKFHREDVLPEVLVTARLQPGSPDHTDRHATCRITVQDNGIGFDEKFADRIFAPFQRLQGHSNYQGTGMGLAICRRILERHHGTITAGSTPGKGSVFTAILPVHQEAVPGEEVGKAAEVSAP